MKNSENAAADAILHHRSRHGLEVTVFDVIAFGFSALGVLWSLVMVLAVAPRFSAMFSDFGSELPVFTALYLKPWFPPLLALAPMAIAGAGVVGGAPRALRAVLMAMAIFLTVTLPAVFLVGMYLPIFSLADAVK